MRRGAWHAPVVEKIKLYGRMACAPTKNIMTNSYTTKSTNSLQGEIEISPDKSISHRSLIFAAIARGESTIENLLLGEDVLATLAILNQLGVKTSHTKETLQKGDVLTVHGVGLHGLKSTSEILYCGNSGTTMRLLLGLTSGANLEVGFTGDVSLNKRPMERITKPLERMGAKFSIAEQNEKRIVRTLKHAGLKAMSYDSPVASAQVKTAILLAGLFAEGKTQVTEPYVSRNHTETMFQAMGANLKTDGTTVTLHPPQKLNPIHMNVPGDISSAAFFIVAALITPNSEVFLKNVNVNETRTGILDVLLEMGADIQLLNKREQSGEAVADLLVKTSRLKNIHVQGEVIPRLIDEVPILALAASVSEGEFELSDASELRVKETDRIKALNTELSKLGVCLTEKQDGFVIQGREKLQVQERNFLSYGDHRIAMMLVIAGLICNEELKIDDVDCIATSFPEFFELLSEMATGLGQSHLNN